MSAPNDNYQTLLDDAVDMRGKIAALEAQVGELEGTLPGRMLGCQWLADEKCKWFLIRAETAEAQNRALREALNGLLARHNDGSAEQHWAEWDTACAALAATEKL